MNRGFVDLNAPVFLDYPGIKEPVAVETCTPAMSSNARVTLRIMCTGHTTNCSMPLGTYRREGRQPVWRKGFSAPSAPLRASNFLLKIIVLFCALSCFCFVCATGNFLTMPGTRFSVRCQVGETMFTGRDS